MSGGIRRPGCAHLGATEEHCAVCYEDAGKEARIVELLSKAAESRDPKPSDMEPPMTDEQRRAKMRELTAALSEICRGGKP